MKKENKKNKVLVFSVLSLFAITLVAAIGYYAIFSASFTVNPSITIGGDLDQDLGDVYDRELIEGTPITITNNASSERIITLSDDSGENVSVSYLKSLEMEIKNPSWEIQGVGAVLHYTVIGNNFIYKTESVEGYNLTDYVVVYYPDSTGNPGPWNIGSAVIIGDVSSELVISDTVTEDLPFDSDFNDKAKLWLMPRIDVETETWDINTVLFEHNLITYTKSNSGTMVINSGENVELTPVYVIAPYTTGSYIVTTTVA